MKPYIVLALAGLTVLTTVGSAKKFPLTAAASVPAARGEGRCRARQKRQHKSGVESRTPGCARELDASQSGIRRVVSGARGRTAESRPVEARRRSESHFSECHAFKDIRCFDHCRVRPQHQIARRTRGYARQRSALILRSALHAVLIYDRIGKGVTLGTGVRTIMCGKGWISETFVKVADTQSARG